MLDETTLTLYPSPEPGEGNIGTCLLAILNLIQKLSGYRAIQENAACRSDPSAAVGMTVHFLSLLSSFNAITHAFAKCRKHVNSEVPANLKIAEPYVIPLRAASADPSFIASTMLVESALFWPAMSNAVP